MRRSGSTVSTGPLGQAEIVDVRLLESAFKVEEFDTGGSLSFDLDVTPSSHYEPGNDHFIVNADYKVTISGDTFDDAGEPDTKVLARCTFRVAGLFVIDKKSLPEIPSNELKTFAETRGVTVIHPYAREFIQDMTSRAGLAPLTLPFVRPFPTGESR